LNSKSDGPAGLGFTRGKRRAMRVSQEDLVTWRPMEEGRDALWIVEPSAGGVDLESWAASNRERIESELLAHGALLFRGFGVASAAAFRSLAQTVTPDLLDYTERAAPRLSVDAGVYTSTEFPADQRIPMHHEMSYSHNWPTKIWFYCDQPPESGGRTPITDDRELLAHIDPRVRQRFADKGVMYVRNYGEGVDLTWQEAFQTEDRAQVEAYCRDAHMQTEWRDGDRLRTRAVRQVLARHPVTGDTVWFNHAHMFHCSNLSPEVRAALLEEFAEDELPRNAFHADGSPIDAAMLDHLRELYWQRAMSFPWLQGDVLLVDNFLVSHGRQPFTGRRRVLVAMAELYTNRELAAVTAGEAS